MSDEGNGDGQLRAENARRRLANVKLKADNAALQAQVATLTTERDGLKSAAVDPKIAHDQAKELAELKKEVRLGKHRDGLKELAYSEEIGINKSVPIDKLIAISGYRADADEFDAKAAAKLLEGLKKSDPYLFGGEQPAAETTGAPDQSHLWRAVQNRGEAGGVSSKAGSITREQSRDAAFVMNQAAERRREAAKAK